MSMVRMCDRCGNVFSENAVGWTTFTGTRVTRDEQGRTRQITVQQDLGPECSATSDEVQPTLAITASAGADRIADTMTQADRDRILNGE